MTAPRIDPLTASRTDASSNARIGARALGLLRSFDAVAARIPADLIAVTARFAMAATFWKAGQTKITGLAIDLVEGRFELGRPRLAESATELFRTEYKLPFLPAEAAAPLAAAAEHVFSALLLVGLATRLSAGALLAMTAVIEIFVYPDAYALHGAWAACLLLLMKYGAGRASLDALLGGRGARDGSL
jgi:putative oxidoreductase